MSETDQQIFWLENDIKSLRDDNGSKQKQIDLLEEKLNNLQGKFEDLQERFGSLLDRFDTAMYR